MTSKLHQLIAQHGTLFLPDIGTFFNDDSSIAIQLIDRLVEANVKVIKGEVLNRADVCLQSGSDEYYYSSHNDQMISENYRELIERKVVSLDTYNALFSHIRNRGCELVLSVYDTEGIDYAIDQGVIAIKIASSNITHLPLLVRVSNTDLPIIIDTGHSTIEEVARAVNVLNDAGKTDIIVEHSPLAPPNPVEEHNLRFMQTLGNSFGLPYGLSDHHISEEMLYAATAMGAVIVEKGVCPDDLGDDQDRAHALNISEVATVQKKISNISKGLGDGVRQLKRNRTKYRSRMCMYARTSLKKGEELTLENIGFAFPLLGIGVEYVEQILGRRVIKSIRRGQAINWSDLLE